jgi:NTE family protein
VSVAVVLPGGGARGAYEVGALSTLLPALKARGERVSIWCGTSVGAINAAALASLAHLSADEQAQQAVARGKVCASRM